MVALLMIKTTTKTKQTILIQKGAYSIVYAKGMH